MGLLKAGVGALSGALADQWREYFYCDAIENDVLVTKGVKRTSKRSSNTKGSENVISNGSIVAVADGQCMIIVEQGKIAELCAEPGEYTYNNKTASSLFTGSLGDSIKNTFKNIGYRFTFGGDVGHDFFCIDGLSQKPAGKEHAQSQQNQQKTAQEFSECHVCSSFLCSLF